MASSLILRAVGLAQQPERQPRDDSCTPKLEFDAISQAYAYHKVLVQNVTDVVTDNEFGYKEPDDSDEFGYKELSDSDDSDLPKDDRHGDDGLLNQMDGGHVSRQELRRLLAKVKRDTSLIESSGVTDRPAGSCENSNFRAGLWARDPQFISKLAGLDASFLLQIAYLCVRAKLRLCRHQPCVEMKDRMRSTAPSCDWAAYREWALLAMSCQAAMGEHLKLSQAHTHLARAISGCCMILKRCLVPTSRELLFVPFLNPESGERIDLADVSNLIYWMAKIQSQTGIGPRNFGRWDNRLLPPDITLPSIEKATQDIEDMNICKNRLWSLVNLSDRKQADLPDIVLALAPYQRSLKHSDHEFCTPSKCQSAQLNSTSVIQLHKCSLGRNTQREQGERGAKGGDSSDEQRATTRKGAGTGQVSLGVRTECFQRNFPAELLETALELGKSTAWLCESVKLSGPNDPYMAISHVWSDGTGVGLKEPGTVNSCLFNFFATIASRLDCKAIWWDALSIPSEPKARSRALNVMHSNYANAKYTLVHDNYLLNFPWKDDGSPCLALVLSTWFTRGWTALELSMSKRVKVLFKDPETSQPVIKDLDQDILAHSPATTSRAHWLATTLIHRLRKPIGNIGDLLAILSPRSTSWARDRAIIAALLAGVPDCDFTVGESLITAQVLKYVGRIPYACLFHGKPTMRNRGKYSWCAATLDDMPVDNSSDMDGALTAKSYGMLEIDEAGAVEGRWRCRPLRSLDVGRIKAHGNDLAAVVKINIALGSWERCLLLRHPLDRLNSEGSLALLVVPLSVVKFGPILKCRYIGAVVEDGGSLRKTNPRGVWRFSRVWTVRLGGTDSGKTGMLGSGVEGLMDRYHHPSHGVGHQSDDSDDESVRNDDGRESDSEKAEPAGEDEAKKSQSRKYPTDELNDDENDDDQRAHLLQLVHIPRVRTATPQPPEMNREHLITALKTKNEAAARYLISHGIDLESVTPESLFRALGGVSERTLSRVKLLGDIYADNNKPTYAVNAYCSVLKSWYLLRQGVTIKNALLPLTTKYSLGSVYLRVKGQESQDKQGRSRLDGRPFLDKAKELFVQILKGCDARRLKGFDIQKNGEPKLLGAGSTSTQERVERADMSAPALAKLDAATRDQDRDEKKKVVNRIKDEQGWYKLELNTIAELTLLHIDQFDLDRAAETYRRALKRFGCAAKGDIEAFKGMWSSRHGDRFRDKKKRLEEATAVYQRAVKRFDTMFRMHHVLIAITSLNLGINYMLRSKFPEAEVQLTRAFQGFVEHFFAPGDDNAPVLDTMNNGEHAILGVTRYHLGLLFASQQRPEKAAAQLQQARDIFSAIARRRGPTSDAAVMKLAATCALGESELLPVEEEPLSRRPRQTDFGKVYGRFREVLDDIADPHSGAKPHSDALTRLVFKAEVGRAKVLYHGWKKPLEAIDVCNGAINMAYSRRTIFYDPDLDVCEAKAFLGTVYLSLGRLAEAEAEVEQSLHDFELLDGDKTMSYLQTATLLADIYTQRHETKKAEKILKTAYNNFVDTLGTLHPLTLKTSLQLGNLHLFQGRLGDAEMACERAHQGFSKMLGPEHRSTAQAAQILGAVYFEMGKLGRSRDLHEQAFSVFNAAVAKDTDKVGPARRSWKKRDADLAIVTDSATLCCAMDLARVCAVFRDPENRFRAEEMYTLAMKGFESAGEGLESTGEGRSLDSLEAKLRFGCFYREEGNFREAKNFIEQAISGFQRLCATGSKPAEIKHLEAKLALGQLLLSQRLGSRQDGNDDDGNRQNENDAESVISDVRDQLAKLLGENGMLTLAASTVLGELYLHDQKSCFKGKKMLEAVLCSYKDNVALPPGHHKRIKVAGILIDFFMGQRDFENAYKMKDNMWRELVEAYGVDLAAMIMEMTNLARPISNLNGDSDDDEEDKGGREKGLAKDTESDEGDGAGDYSGPDTDSSGSGDCQISDAEDDDSQAGIHSKPSPAEPAETAKCFAHRPAVASPSPQSRECAEDMSQSSLPTHQQPASHGIGSRNWSRGTRPSWRHR